jgi:hypothetical protein
MFIDSIEKLQTKNLDFLILKLALVYLNLLHTKKNSMLSRFVERTKFLTLYREGRKRVLKLD